MRTWKCLVLTIALPALVPLCLAAQTPRRPGVLGIAFAPLDTLGTRGGPAVVAGVLPGSPADRAGVERGDTIVEWDGHRRVGDAIQSRAVRAGDTVKLRLRHGTGRDRVVSVVAVAPRDVVPGVRVYGGRDTIIIGDTAIVLNARDLANRMRVYADSLRVQMDSLRMHMHFVFADSIEPQMRAAARALEDAHVRVVIPPTEVSVLDLGRRSVAGAEFSDVNAGLGSYFGASRGALVLRAAPDTPAAHSGLRAGDVVLEANGKPVSSVDDLRNAVIDAQRANRRSVPLQILREHRRQSLELKWK
ncbi:MAG TPA: PDZ domain-containing protein [Longimicrobiaceae bacterium]|nr:PDZ domain-containing protein [Longimicrobiaceae bacterium]